MASDDRALTPTEFVLYQSDDGLARVQIRLHDGTVWLTQRDLAALYQVSVSSINEHVRKVYSDGEQPPEATIRKFRIVRSEGDREIFRTVDHYSLPVVLAVGYRVRSTRGTQFRQWATTRLADYLVKGFAIDDERLKQPVGPGAPDYFDELLARIRDIRSSERVFYRKVLDIYATSVDYDPRADASQRFFATVQNKMHWAAHGHTAAEVIAERVDAAKPNVGLTSWSGARPRRADVAIAKNYLAADELDALNRIVTAYLEFAELQALGRRPMHMADWIAKLDDFLRLGDRDVLHGLGSVSHEAALQKANDALDRYEVARAKLPAPVDAYFDEAARAFEALAKRRPKPKRR